MSHTDEDQPDRPRKRRPRANLSGMTPEERRAYRQARQRAWRPRKRLPEHVQIVPLSRLDPATELKPVQAWRYLPFWLPYEAWRRRYSTNSRYAAPVRLNAKGQRVFLAGELQAWIKANPDAGRTCPGRIDN